MIDTDKGCTCLVCKFVDEVGYCELQGEFIDIFLNGCYEGIEKEVE